MTVIRGGSRAVDDRGVLGYTCYGRGGVKSDTWTGFAGVAQTTVERLLREGGSVDEDATDAPLAGKLATLTTAHNERGMHRHRRLSKVCGGTGGDDALRCAR